MTRINDCIVLMRRLLLAAVAILPTACVSDIDDCTPKTPENAAPVIFSLDLNTSPISTRADETTGDSGNTNTEIRIALSETDSPITPSWYQQPLSSTKFPDIVAGPITITYNNSNTENVDYLEVSINTSTKTKLHDANTPDVSGELIIQLSEDQASLIAQYGLVFGSNNITVTKVTYTAKKSLPDEPDPVDPDLQWNGSYNPGEEDEMDCVINPDNLHLLIFDSETEKLIAWVKNARLNNNTENENYEFSGLLSKSIDEFKTAVGCTSEAADGSSTNESPNKVIVLALANWPARSVNSLLKEGTDLSELEKNLRTFIWDASLSAKENGCIPMWGQSRTNVIFSESKVNFSLIKLLRALAKVKISLSNSSTAPYYIESVQVRNYNKIGYYMPNDIRRAATEEGGATPLKDSTDELSVADCFKPYTPSVLSSTAELILPEGTKSYIAYLPEQLNDGADVEASSHPEIGVKLKSLDSGNDCPDGEVLEGVIRFTSNGLEDGTPKNIIRNHQYDFTIKIQRGIKISVAVNDMIDGGTYSYEYVIR